MYWNWEKMDLFSRNDLVAWHQYQAGVSGHHIIYDASGHNRHLVGDGSNAPVLTAGVIAGQPAWLFNGSRVPLKFTGNLTVRHLFVVAAISGAAFTDYNGLLTGLDDTSVPVLIGTGNASSVFYDLNTVSISNYTYRKSDILFEPDNQLVPFNNAFAILEMQFPDRIDLDGIQIGQDREDTSRRLSGWFAEDLMFEQVKNDAERLRIYRYFAMRYHLWRRKADNIPIFPFCFNRSTPFTKTDLAEISEAEGQRGRDRVVRYLDDAPLGSYDFRFELRRTVELQAANAFTDERRLHLPFWIEDKEREQERKIVRDSPAVGNQPSSVNLQNYGFTGKDY